MADFQAQNVTAYDPAGRPAIITAGSHTATYRYVANSRIRAGVTYRANGTQRLDTQYDFDRLNRLQQVLNQPSAAGQPAERHAYTYNAAQQRIRDELADGSSWNWEYDRLKDADQFPEKVQFPMPSVAEIKEWISWVKCSCGR